jgi:hypothetical protein
VGTSEGRSGAPIGSLYPRKLLKGCPGLVKGSLLFLVQGITPPSGYTLLGTTQLTIQLPPGKRGVLKVNVYQKTQ